MKPPTHFIIINIILSLFFYIGLAERVSCPNADKYCYYLNELLAPCNGKIDFSGVRYNSLNYYQSVGVDGKFNKQQLNIVIRHENDNK
jgi:hypothetical protein